MSDTTATVVGVALGWSLGWLTTPIVNWYERRRTALALAGPLEAELRDLQVRSAMAAHYIKGKHSLCRDDVQWELDVLVDADDDRARTTVHAMREILRLSDAQLAVALKDPARVGTATSLKRLDLPFLNAHVHQIDVFKPRVQSHLLALATEIRIYNEIVDEARAYLSLTFTPGISQANYDKVDGNYKSAEQKCAERLRRIADRARETVRSLRAKS